MSPITVQYKNKIRIQDLTEITDFDISVTKIDTTSISTSGKQTLRTEISSFARQNEILNAAAARRYRTEENNLQATDLHLFSKYAQDNTSHEKDVYFETFPIIESDPLLTNNEISANQLLTKFNIEDFESYLSNKNLNSYSCIPSYNWENEIEYEPITSFVDLLKTTKNDSRATYKFEYTTLKPNKNNVERTTNIVPLNQFKYKNGSIITAMVHYSVAGFVAVKSDLDDQRSGTIYLEARDARNKNDEWRTIDSAVFKFIPNGIPKNDPKYSPGTYVTLNGYLSTEFETRLKLNLKSHGYSMNLYEDRDISNALTNHYVNTFIGFVHIPDAIANQPNQIYFSNINYYSYLKDGKGVLFKSRNINNVIYVKTVNELLKLFNINPANTFLEISSTKMVRIISGSHKPDKNFIINGIRTSPIGKVYKIGETFETPLKLEAGMTIYPSYASGEIEAVRPASITKSFTGYPELYTIKKSNILNSFDYSELTVLPKLKWNSQTEIYGNISAELLATNNGGTQHVEETTLSFNRTYSAADYATDDPRRQYVGKSYVFDFSKYLKNRTIKPNTLITCSMDIWPRTWGRGDGNESYGRVYDGTGKIINRRTLETKNITRAFTFGLCTGSKWNYSAQSSNITFTQPSNYTHFTLYAAADTAKDDGRDETWFGVYAKNIEISFKEIVDGPSQEDANYGSYRGELSSINNKCIMSHTIVTPNRIKNVTITPKPVSNISGLTDTTKFNDITASMINFTTSKYGMGSEYTTLTVKPYPQNLVL